MRAKAEDGGGGRERRWREEGGASGRDEMPRQKEAGLKRVEGSRGIGVHAGGG